MSLTVVTMAPPVPDALLLVNVQLIANKVAFFYAMQTIHHSEQDFLFVRGGNSVPDCKNLINLLDRQACKMNQLCA